MRFVDGYKTYIAGFASLLYGVAVYFGWLGNGGGFDAAMPYFLTGLGLFGLGGKLEKLLGALRK